MSSNHIDDIFFVVYKLKKEFNKLILKLLHKADKKVSNR